MIEVDVDRLGLLHWMADGRIVAGSVDGGESQRLSWGGSTLDELASRPLDFSCGVVSIEVGPVDTGSLLHEAPNTSSAAAARELVPVLDLGLIAQAVAITGAVLELFLRPLLGAHLILRTWHRLIGAAVTITTLFVIDTGGNRSSRFGGVGLGQCHPCWDGEQSDRGECQHHLAHDHSFPSVSSRLRCRNPFPGLIGPLVLAPPI